MNEKEIGAFAVAEMHNEQTYPSSEARAFIDARTKLHLCDLDFRHSLYEEMRPTREEREIKSRLNSRLLDKLGARNDYERLRQLGRERLEANRVVPRLAPLDTRYPGTSLIQIRLGTELWCGGPGPVGSFRRPTRLSGWTAAGYTSPQAFG